MKVNLTDRAIRAIATPVRTSITWDVEEPRFGLKVQPSGTKSFILQYRNASGDNKEVRIARWPDFNATTARAKARELKAQIAQGSDPLAAKRDYKEGSTLGELVGKYYDRHLKGTASGEERSRLLKKEVVPVLGARTKAVDVDRRDIIHLFKNRSRSLSRKKAKRLRRKSEATPVTANHVLAAIRSMYNWAADNEEIDYRHANPTRGIKKNPEKGRQRFLSNIEIAAFWHKLSDGWKIGDDVVAALRLILATAKRSGEICNMRWRDISKDQHGYWWWTIPATETKNDQEDKVALNDLALDIIESRRQQKSPDDKFVFPSNQVGHLDRQSLTRALNRKDKDGVYVNRRRLGKWCEEHPFTPHDLRRTVASHLQMLKVPLPVTERILNHVSGGAQGATAVYTRYQYDDEAREAMARWSNKLREIITGEKSKVQSIR